ncbi:unnamed protein product, partial [Amoebophrya sp. A120]
PGRALRRQLLGQQQKFLRGVRTKYANKTCERFVAGSYVAGLDREEKRNLSYIVADAYLYEKPRRCVRGKDRKAGLTYVARMTKDDKYLKKHGIAHTEVLRAALAENKTLDKKHNLYRDPDCAPITLSNVVDVVKDKPGHQLAGKHLDICHSRMVQIMNTDAHKKKHIAAVMVG